MKHVDFVHLAQQQWRTAKNVFINSFHTESRNPSLPWSNILTVETFSFDLYSNIELDIFLDTDKVN